jgi:excinuclease ABC subunit C
MITNAYIKTFPSSCGVYIFWQDKTPIYIGKAINIKARLLSHFVSSQTDSKEAAIIENADTLTILETDSEFNALVLEAQLIQKHLPKYNIIWKDNKSYLYIKITIKDLYPKILITRRERDGKSLYFGPFSGTRLARNLIYQIRKIIPFCTHEKMGTRACFESKIKLCDPCPNYLEKIKNTSPELYQKGLKQYRSNIRKVINLLKGQSTTVISELQKDMMQKTRQGKYEDAMEIRNKIMNLTNLLQYHSFSQFSIEYLLANTYEEQLGSVNDFMKTYFNEPNQAELGRFECYDISNLMGTNPTASMVVFNEGKPDKKYYRKFKIKTVKGISDFAMMNEVLSRRFKHTEWPQPRLLIMDGGKPQVRVGLKVKKTLHIDTPLIGIAKHPDRIILGNESLRTIYLQQDNSFFKMVQNLRDESHRFAKKYHTYLRTSNMFK